MLGLNTTYSSQWRWAICNTMTYIGFHVFYLRVNQVHSFPSNYFDLGVKFLPFWRVLSSIQGFVYSLLWRSCRVNLLIVMKKLQGFLYSLLWPIAAGLSLFIVMTYSCSVFFTHCYDVAARFPLFIVMTKLQGFLNLLLSRRCRVSLTYSYDVAAGFP